MKAYKLVITENSRMIFSTVQSRQFLVSEVLSYLSPNGIWPEENNSFHISIKEVYMNQYGKIDVKYKKGTYSFFKHFVIHYNEFNYSLLQSELEERLYN